MNSEVEEIMSRYDGQREVHISRERFDLIRFELSRLRAEVVRLRADLNYYQVEAVARTGTDARTKP